MEDEEFHFHKIIISEKTVVLPCLKKYFETKWKLQYPDTPWNGDAISVKIFESKEDEVFKKTLKELSGRKNEIWKRTQRRNQMHAIHHDDQWNNYHWDISKFKYALVDSKVFKLDDTDEVGIPVSEHIVKIKKIRDNTAHSTKAACKREHCDKILTEIIDHIKAMEGSGFDTHTYIEDIERIKSEEKPISCKEHCEMRLQYEKLKYENQIYKEREKTFEEKEKNTQLLEELNEVRGKHNNITEKLNLAEQEKKEKTDEIKMLKLKLKQQCPQHSVRVQNVNKLKSQIDAESEVRKVDNRPSRHMYLLNWNESNDFYQSESRKCFNGRHYSCS